MAGASSYCSRPRSIRHARRPRPSSSKRPPRPVSTWSSKPSSLPSSSPRTRPTRIPPPTSTPICRCTPCSWAGRTPSASWRASRPGRSPPRRTSGRSAIDRGGATRTTTGCGGRPSGSWIPSSARPSSSATKPPPSPTSCAASTSPPGARTSGISRRGAGTHRHHEVCGKQEAGRDTKGAEDSRRPLKARALPTTASEASDPHNPKAGAKEQESRRGGHPPGDTGHVIPLRRPEREEYAVDDGGSRQARDIQIEGDHPSKKRVVRVIPGDRRVGVAVVRGVRRIGASNDRTFGLAPYAKIAKPQPAADVVLERPVDRVRGRIAERLVTVDRPRGLVWGRGDRSGCLTRRKREAQVADGLPDILFESQQVLHGNRENAGARGKGGRSRDRVANGISGARRRDVRADAAFRCGGEYQGGREGGQNS